MTTGDLDVPGAGTPAATGDPATADAWAAAHRAALDHVLGLCAGQWWSDGLVLRGSMLLPVWLGAAARPPADVDWVVVNADPGRSLVGAPVGLLPDLVEWCPRIETDGPFDDDYHRPRATTTEKVGDDGEGGEDPDPTAPDPWDTPCPYGDLLDLVARQPVASHGVVLDAAEAWADEDWSSSYYHYGDLDALNYDPPGQRLMIPWRAPGLPPGRVRFDFSCDEWLPEPARPTLVPRADGGAPALVLAASRELSLAWKVRWLAFDGGPADSTPDEDGYDYDEDIRPRSAGRGKDLYDAVLLAEGCDARRLPSLLRAVWGRGSVSALDEVASWSVDWDPFRARHPWVEGTVGDWLARLSRRLPPAWAVPPPFFGDG